MLYIIILIAVIILDRISKILVLNHLTNIDTIPIINNIFHLTFAKNTGAAFSIFTNSKTLLIFSSILFICLLCAFLFWQFKKGYKNKYFYLALSFIIGGAIGNLIDRITYGYVIDYFDFRLINFAIFNVADSFICVGAGILILVLLFDKSLEI